MRRLAAIQRVDHGLHYGRRPVIGPGVGPAFQIVRAVDMPFRNHSGLVQMRAEVRGRLHVRNGLFKMQVHRRGVDRVGIQDQQPVNLTCAYVIHQGDDVLPLDGRHGIYGFGVNHRLADVAQRLVDGNRRQMHLGRLLLTGDDHALARAGLQISRYGGEKLARGAGGRLRARPTRSNCCRQRRSERSHLAGLQGQTVLGLEAGRAGSAFDGVQPVHRSTWVQQLAPAGIIGRQAEKAGMSDAGEEVRVERDDHIRILQPILSVVVITESSLRGRVGRIAVDRVPLQPLGVGIFLLRRFPLRRQGRRGHGVAQDVEAGASACLLVGQHGAEDSEKSSKLTDFSTADHSLRAVRIVKIEQGALGQRIGGAAVNRVIRIAVHFDRPVSVALDQDRHRAGVEGHSRGKIHRTTEYQIFGFLDVRIDRFIRLLGTAGKPSQGERSAHDLEESAPRDGIDPLRSLRGKFTLHHLPEGRRVGQLVHAAPVGLSRLAGKFGPGSVERKCLVILALAVDRLVCHVRFASSLVKRLRILQVLLTGLGRACLAHRWQVSQLLSSWGVRMWYCWVRYLPSDAWSVNFS